MRLRAEDFAGHVRGTLARVYLISGDETLLVEEACDAVISRAHEEGFSERTVLHVDTGFKWHDLHQEASSMSLFAERRVIDLRVPANKFDKSASEALREYVDSASADNILLIRTRRLEARQRNAAWFKAIDGGGVVVLIWPMELRRLPGWLAERARVKGIQLTREGLEYLTARVEGNLLAAVQEIEKLRLAELSQPIDADAVAHVVEDATHFDAFELIDAVFAGNPARVHKILITLREEGVAIFAVLGALTAQLRMLQSGRRLPGPRQRLVEGFMRRVRSIPPVLAQCALVDQQAKGMLHGDAWLSLENLLLRMAGSRTLPSLEVQLEHLKY
ncbi:MAG: DNA polymerase III subunit delta [Pseudomonadales bacterium]|nr:DNA polymerase III subunit delta [Pseudomonadales bacterium]MDP6470228.1 DNA polymerase III subunit delta [Pseudomonadales bacterium]MDP6827134.1 DNA polymerase III subunit delta [Pseudomonadales bacterium]MDP6971572.1 DNA polymerase III subunit delta [Pseudomonadales bacterium]